MSNKAIPTPITKDISREPRKFIEYNKQYLLNLSSPGAFDKRRLAILDELESDLDELDILRVECISLENSQDKKDIKSELDKKTALLNQKWEDFRQERMKVSRNLPFPTAPPTLREVWQDFLDLFFG